MVKHRAFPTALAVLTMVALPGAAHATATDPGPTAKLITSDTTLKFGQKGVLNLHGWQEGFKARKYPVGVRVVKIEKGKRSDLKGHRLPAAATGMVPWYIRAELSYAGADWQGGGPGFGGIFSDGSTAKTLFTREDIGPCAGQGVHKLSKRQRIARHCTVVLAPPGAPVTGAFTFHSVKHRSIKVTWKK